MVLVAAEKLPEKRAGQMVCRFPRTAQYYRRGAPSASFRLLGRPFLVIRFPNGANSAV